jgi:hypothetical protein
LNVQVLYSFFLFEDKTDRLKAGKYYPYYATTEWERPYLVPSENKI